MFHSVARSGVSLFLIREKGKQGGRDDNKREYTLRMESKAPPKLCMSVGLPVYRSLAVNVPFTARHSRHASFTGVHRRARAEERVRGGVGGPQAAAR